MEIKERESAAQRCYFRRYEQVTEGIYNPISNERRLMGKCRRQAEDIREARDMGLTLEKYQTIMGDE